MAGDVDAFWTAAACLYLSQLENAAPVHTHHYRCYFTDSVGRTVHGTSVRSADDAHATEQSMALLATNAMHRGVELWNRDRLVFRHIRDCGGSPSAPESPGPSLA